MLRGVGISLRVGQCARAPTWPQTVCEGARRQGRADPGPRSRPAAVLCVGETGRRSRRGDSRTAVAGNSGEGWKGEADVAILFRCPGASRGAGGPPFGAPLLKVSTCKREAPGRFET